MGSCTSVRDAPLPELSTGFFPEYIDTSATYYVSLDDGRVNEKQARGPWMPVSGWTLVFFKSAPLSSIPSTDTPAYRLKTDIPTFSKLTAGTAFQIMGEDIIILDDEIEDEYLKFDGKRVWLSRVDMTTDISHQPVRLSST